MKPKTIKLTIKQNLEIIPTAPFHFDSTFYKPAHFPSSDWRWQPGKRWQTMLWQRQKLGLIYENKGTDLKPRVGVKIFSAGSLSSEFLDYLKKEIIWRFNLNLDLKDFYQAVGNNPLLRPIIKKFSGLRPMHYGSLYEYLMIDIVLQNATVKRSVYMLQALFENYGSMVEFAGKKFFCYWEPEILANTAEQALRDLKMGYRAKSLIKVSQAFAQKEIDELSLRNKSIAEQEETLLSLYGIGPASVGYIMVDALHRWDYLKHISPWEQKIYTHIFFKQDHETELVPVAKMLKRFGKWGEWKALVVHYVWEDIWWQRRHKTIPWLEKLIRL